MSYLLNLSYCWEKRGKQGSHCASRTQGGWYQHFWKLKMNFTVCVQVALCSLVVSAEGFNCSCWEVMESLLNLGRNCLIGLARTPIHREQTRDCGNRVVRHGGGYKVQMLEWNNQNLEQRNPLRLNSSLFTDHLYVP